MSLIAFHFSDTLFLVNSIEILHTRSLWARWAPTSRPPARTPGPAPRTPTSFGPSGLLDFVFHVLRALKPCYSKLFHLHVSHHVHLHVGHHVHLHDGHHILHTFMCFFTGTDRRPQRLRHRWERLPKHIELSSGLRKWFPAVQPVRISLRINEQGDSRCRISAPNMLSYLLNTIIYSLVVTRYLVKYNI